MSAFEVKLQNVALMEAERGYDVTIICTSDAQQSAYWEKRLGSKKGSVTPTASTIIAVDEDWDGGAGNFLGTLYAWRKACKRHKEVSGGDLAAELAGGASVAIFHTAGKGTRLAPLPGAENNNKPGVKLPAPGAPCILECVIRQTGAYAGSRKRRLSVFWGDQIFVPSVPATYTPSHHVDIACALGPMPSAEEWERRGLQAYGCIAACDDSSVAAMLEKVSHETASQALKGLDKVTKVGTSLGSFSLSSAFLQALDAGFTTEVDARKGKMDTDPHVWMPMTLDESSYAAIAVQKGLFDDAAARAHHQRISAIVAGFDVSSDGLSGGMFGAVTVGQDMAWWDYGLIKLFAKNSLLLTEASEDAKLARAFFGIDETARVGKDCSLGACAADGVSVVSATRAQSGSISGSALVGVTASEIRAEAAVLVNVCAKKVVAAPGSVAYNILDTSEEGLVLKENEVRVGVFTLDSARPYFEMRSDREEIDGGKVFKERVCGNALSFQEVYDLNSGVDVSACAEAAGARSAAFAESLLPKEEGDAKRRKPSKP